MDKIRVPICIFGIARQLNNYEGSNLTTEILRSSFLLFNYFNLMTLGSILIYNIATIRVNVIYGSAIMAIIASLISHYHFRKQSSIFFLIGIVYSFLNWAVLETISSQYDLDISLYILTTLVFFFYNVMALQRLLFHNRIIIFFLIWILETLIFSGGLRTALTVSVVVLSVGLVGLKYYIRRAFKDSLSRSPNMADFNFLPNAGARNTDQDNQNSARGGNKLDISIGHDKKGDDISADQVREAKDAIKKRLNFEEPGFEIKHKEAEDLGAIDKIYADEETPGENNYVVPQFNPNVHITEEELPGAKPVNFKIPVFNQKIVLTEETDGPSPIKPHKKLVTQKTEENDAHEPQALDFGHTGPKNIIYDNFDNFENFESGGNPKKEEPEDFNWGAKKEEKPFPEFSSNTNFQSNPEPQQPKPELVPEKKSSDPIFNTVNNPFMKKDPFNFDQPTNPEPKKENPPDSNQAIDQFYDFKELEDVQDNPNLGNDLAKFSDDPKEPEQKNSPQGQVFEREIQLEADKEETQQEKPKKAANPYHHENLEENLDTISPRNEKLQEQGSPLLPKKDMADEFYPKKEEYVEEESYFPPSNNLVFTPEVHVDVPNEEIEEPPASGQEIVENKFEEVEQNQEVHIEIQEEIPQYVEEIHQKVEEMPSQQIEEPAQEVKIEIAEPEPTIEPEVEKVVEITAEKLKLRAFDKSHLIFNRDGTYDHSQEINKEYFQLLEKCLEITDQEITKFKNESGSLEAIADLELETKTHVLELIKLYDKSKLQFKNETLDTRYGHTSKFIKLVKRSGLDYESFVKKIKDEFFPSPPPQKVEAKTPIPTTSSTNSNSTTPIKTQSTIQPTRSSPEEVKSRDSQNLSKSPIRVDNTQSFQSQYSLNKSPSIQPNIQNPENKQLQRGSSMNPTPPKPKIDISALTDLSSLDKNKKPENKPTQPEVQKKIEISNPIPIYNISELDILNKPTTLQKPEELNLQKSKSDNFVKPKDDFDLMFGNSNTTSTKSQPQAKESDPFADFVDPNAKNSQQISTFNSSPTKIDTLKQNPLVQRMASKAEVKNLFNFGGDDQEEEEDEKEEDESEGYYSKYSFQPSIVTQENDEEFPFDVSQPENPAIKKIKDQIKNFNKLKLVFKQDGSLDMSKSSCKEFMKLVEKTKEEPKKWIGFAKQQLQDMLRYFDKTLLKFKADGSLDMKKKLNKEFVLLCQLCGENVEQQIRR